MVEIPYETDEASFMVFLPVGDFERARNSISVKKLKQTISSMHGAAIKVVLPNFKMETGLSLKESLRNIGLVNLFDEKTCELGNICDDKGLVVSDITQKVMLKIDERGTEAASASVCCLTNSCDISKEPKLFVADRPFLFAVWNKNTEVPLFFGQMCRPDQCY
jgi:serine protease inhibitor